MLEKEIVKAEILFSRKCNLKCSYCAMADGRENTLSVLGWLKGMRKLKQLGCGLVAFYGAEPLLEFEKLVEILPYAEHLNIPTTLITNGSLVGTKPMLLRLYKEGARSLSMSYDPKPIDVASEIKSGKAIDTLTWFKGLGKNVRDVAAIATLTAKNFKYLPGMVKKMSSLDIWTFYDLYHFDRGQPGSKTAEIDDTLTFTKTNSQSLINILNVVNRMKNDGYLVHTNNHYLDILKAQVTKTQSINYSWNCADYDEFPSWITVDCDGSVYPCDDFQPREGRKFSVTEISENWDVFKKQMKLITKATCPGCVWNTKIGAHAIKAGIENINDYVHGD